MRSFRTLVLEMVARATLQLATVAVILTAGCNGSDAPAASAPPAESGSGGMATGVAGAAAGGARAAGGETAGGRTSAGTSSGGAVERGGSETSGGVSSSLAGAPAAAGSGSSEDVVKWTASDYASRKWARWAIPNPVSLGLPHPMSFVDSADTVVDQITGLVWEKTPVDMTMTWQQALDYCTGKGTGWSLPTRIELTSIVDNTRSGPKVGSGLFVFEPKAGWTWASTPWVVNSRKTVDPPLSWFINLSQGDSNNSLSQLAASAYARCVQVPSTQQLPATHYTIDQGEVRDNYTGLSFQQVGSGSSPSLSAEAAAEYCGSLALNGASWRLPSLNELASVVDDVPSGNVSPAVDHRAFPSHSKDQWYWSASPHGGSTTEQWTLSFEDGFTKHQPTSTLGIAQCVHD